MRIAIPVRFHGGGWIGGANYFRSLVRALRLHPDPGGAQAIVLSNRPEEFRLEAGDGSSVRVEDAPWLDAPGRPDWFLNGALNNLLLVNPLLERALSRLGANVATHALPARHSPVPRLLWVQDFQHRYLPGYFSRYERWRRDRNVKAAAASGHVLFSSESAAADFRRFFPLEAHATAHVLRFPPLAGADGDEPTDREVLARYQVASGYFFLPNQLWRHKNHALVAEALRALPARIRVVCTGAASDSRGDAHIHALRESLSTQFLAERMRFLGIVPRADLLALMRGSIAVINPSLFEGWSTTVEESLLLGKRLLLSDLPVHREQAGLGASYFDPASAAQLAAAMLQAEQAHDPAAERERREAALAALPVRVRDFAGAYWRIARAGATR